MFADHFVNLLMHKVVAFFGEKPLATRVIFLIMILHTVFPGKADGQKIRDPISPMKALAALLLNNKNFHDFLILGNKELTCFGELKFWLLGLVSRHELKIFQCYHLSGIDFTFYHP